jgi:putative flippase GtrA
MWLALLDFAIGIGFGFAHKGTESYKEMLKNSAIAGVVMSIILLVLSAVMLPAEFASGSLVPGILGILITIIIYVIIFVIGTFVGDKLEQIFRK